MRVADYWLSAAALAAILLVVVAGGVLASEMGFKITLELDSQSPGVSDAGRHLIALPYRPGIPDYAFGGGVVTAGDLLRYINGGKCVGTPAHAVQKVDPASDGIFSYDGCSGSDFILEPGIAYYLIMRAPADVVINGSHAPGTTIPLLGPGAGSATGTTFYAPPYHQVAATARDLFIEIGPAATAIFRHVPALDAYDVYTFGGGTVPPDGWDLKPGEGYIIKTLSDVTFMPLHY